MTCECCEHEPDRRWKCISCALIHFGDEAPITCRRCNGTIFAPR